MAAYYGMKEIASGTSSDCIETLNPQSVVQTVDIARPCSTSAGGPLQWRHNERDGVINPRRLDCLLNRLFRRRTKKTSKLGVTGPCEVYSPVNDDFPTKRVNNAEMFSFDDVIMTIAALVNQRNIISEDLESPMKSMCLLALKFEYIRRIRYSFYCWEVLQKSSPLSLMTHSHGFLHSSKCIWLHRLQTFRHFALVSMCCEKQSIIFD